jgi:hypothetical protein
MAPTTTVHEQQLALLGADALLLAALDTERAERLAQIRQLREERRLARLGRARPCRCEHPLELERGRCLLCGHELAR